MCPRLGPSVLVAALVAAVCAVPARGQAGNAPTFTVGTATAARGATATGFIDVAAATDSGLHIPVAVIHGAKPGPVVAFVAGSHGTEYTSIVAMQRLVVRSVAGLDGRFSIGRAELIGRGEDLAFVADEDDANLHAIDLVTQRELSTTALGGTPGAVRLGQRGSARDLQRAARDLKRMETIRRFHHEARSLVSESPQ